MELLNCEKLLQRKKVLGMNSSKTETKEATDAVLQGGVALVVFKKAMEAFPDDVEFWISFLPVCRLFHMDHIEKDILRDVQECHPHSELTWDALARRHLYRATQTNADTDTVDADTAMQQAQERCFAVYDEAVQCLDTGQYHIQTYNSSKQQLLMPCTGRALGPSPVWSTGWAWAYILQAWAEKILNTSSLGRAWA
ncbi:hypothetical protein LSAT2_009430 [Lamellibrachia satsuma]|nr:hypothetical protein LSAT2_009430 [Lamellibrachia satsuma]